MNMSWGSTLGVYRAVQISLIFAMASRIRVCDGRIRVLSREQ